MDEAELEHARQKFEELARAELGATPVARVELEQYGDSPEIEPGELQGRVFLAVPADADPADREVRQQVLKEFHKSNPGAISRLSKALGGGAGSGTGLFVTRGWDADPQSPGPVLHLKLKLSRSAAALGLGGSDQPLTAVMARLGPDDLQTLDTLIAAGIAGSRAEAVRWALARIRERPAYEQLRARSREIDALKSQF